MVNHLAYRNEFRWDGLITRGMASCASLGGIFGCTRHLRSNNIRPIAPTPILEAAVVAGVLVKGLSNPGR